MKNRKKNPNRKLNIERNSTWQAERSTEQIRNKPKR